MDNLIAVISHASNKYGDKLLEFMEQYGLRGLIEATEEQLAEYIESNGLWEDNDGGNTPSRTA